MTARRGLVLDVETRTSPALLRSSGRAGAPAKMPRGLQVLTAGAVLRFEQDQSGLCRAVEGRSADAASIGEAGLVRMLERELAELRDAAGMLVTFNGSHDLQSIRLAALRLRLFSNGGAARWLDAGREDHHDLMLAFGDGPARWPSLDDLATALQARVPHMVVAAHPDVRPERTKCEIDVAVTMVVHLHLLAERARSREPLRIGIEELAEGLRAEPRSPHLAAVLQSALMRGQLG